MVIDPGALPGSGIVVLDLPVMVVASSGCPGMPGPASDGTEAAALGAA